MTASTFKERHRNHIKSFQHKKYANNTELSKYIWELKENKQDFRIDWSILKRAISYRGGSNRRNLYLEEKFLILNEKNKDSFLNKKSEIVSACPHKQVSCKEPENNRLVCTPTNPLFGSKHISGPHFEICLFRQKIPHG